MAHESSPVLLRDALEKTRHIVFDQNGPPVLGTVAQRILTAAHHATFRASPGNAEAGVLHISVENSGNASPPWLLFQMNESGSGFVRTSHSQWLFPLSSLMLREWYNRDVSMFEEGIRVEPAFRWLRGLSDFFVGSLRAVRRFDKRKFVEQLAEQGFSHLTINGLGASRAFESGPPGDVYSWFYDYSPDIDQFVEGPLTRNYYPADYLQANLNSLKSNAALARDFGLIPGLHINSPRSMPEDFWQRYGFLRGARVDHPRESFRPRYTLSMSHPAVQEHYRELVARIFSEVPDIGFIHIWTNDSGSGFEYISSLYAGRNGGPYLIREWKDSEEIAKKAAANVLTYFRLVSDEGKKANPEFRLVCDLASFSAERKYMVHELGNGIDVGDFVHTEGKELENGILRSGGAWTHLKLDVGDNTVIGVPYPWLVYERLADAMRRGTHAALLNANPASLAPYDVNNGVVRAVQLRLGDSIDAIVENVAEGFVGSRFSSSLVDIWKHSDQSVRSFPAGVPMSTFAFPWFRFWVRPFVPDIDAIPEADRAYYERFLLATFNNPARVDLNNDMMWNFLTVAEAAQKKSIFDETVLPPLASALQMCRARLSDIPGDSTARNVFVDLHDRLRAYLCFCTTMRNTMAWTEAVHGFIDAKSDDERQRYRALSRMMVEKEIENTMSLFELWCEGTAEVIPISQAGETLHVYGENFGELLKKKIALMELHKTDEPHIDPDFMWRMPSTFTDIV